MDRIEISLSKLETPERRGRTEQAESPAGWRASTEERIHEVFWHLPRKCI